MNRKKIEEAVVALRALAGRDPEEVHSVADGIVLSLAPVAVREVYEALVATPRWWGAT